MRRGMSQLHSKSVRQRVGCETICLDNGGNSGTGYSPTMAFTLRLQGPFSAGIRAGLAPLVSLATLARSLRRGFDAYSSFSLPFGFIANKYIISLLRNHAASHKARVVS